MVAAGPGRILAVALAVGIGVRVARRRASLVHVVWLAALALTLRCVVEPVMVPFYLLPGTLLMTVTSAALDRSRLLVTTSALAAVNVMSFWHTGEWTYYLIMMTLLVIALLASRPGVTTRPAPDTPR